MDQMFSYFVYIFVVHYLQTSAYGSQIMVPYQNKDDISPYDGMCHLFYTNSVHISTEYVI